MKKLIKVFSFIAVVVVFSSISAKAQSDFAGEMQIPFDFSINDRTYEAGTYRFKVTRINIGSATLTIVDPKNERTQTVFAQRSGDEPHNKIDIVFGRIGDKRSLDRIVTPEGGFAINGSRQRREAMVAKNNGRTEIVGSSDLF